MTLVKRIAGINLIVLVVYTLIINSTRGMGGGASAEMLMSIAVSLHVIFCTLAMIFSFIRSKKSHGEAWLLSTGVVLVVGFSACYGSSLI